MRIATVGCGFFSQFHHQAWQDLGVEIAGVCDQDKARSEYFCDRFGANAAYNDFETMLQQSRPDLVDIILPPDTQLDHIRLACNYAETVICQKPFTCSLEQAHSAIEIAEETDTQLVVHENFRFQPWYRQIEEIVDEGRLGQIYQARFALRPGDGQGPDAYLDRQPYFREMDRFLIHETGIHFIDVFRFLFGDVASVWADLRQLNPVIRGEDAGMFILDFGYNKRALFDGNRMCDHVADNHRLTMGELTVEGSRASLELNGQGEIRIRDKGSNDFEPVDYDWIDRGFGGNCVYALQEHVLRCVETGSCPENHARDYIANLEIEKAIYQSNATGTRVELST